MPRGIRGGMFFTNWMFGVTKCEVKGTNMLDSFFTFWDLSVWFIPTDELSTAILWAFLLHNVTWRCFAEILGNFDDDVCASVLVTDDANA